MSGPAAGPFRTSFERLEVKYWAPRALVEEALGLARPFLAADRAQRVTSVYLDTPRRDFYRQHLASAPDRFKLRVRAYGDGTAPFASLEVKRKVGDVVLKRRARVPVALVGPLLAGCAAPAPLEAAERAHLDAFLGLVALHRAAPVLAVRCFRSSWAADDPAWDVRLTVDERIEYQACATPEARAEGPWLPAPSPAARPGVLLELKVQGRLPWWVEPVAARLARHRVAYSKYVAAMGALEGAPWAAPVVRRRIA